jgi:hypothetical protein
MFHVYTTKPAKKLESNPNLQSPKHAKNMKKINQMKKKVNCKHRSAHAKVGISTLIV